MAWGGKSRKVGGVNCTFSEQKMNVIPNKHTLVMSENPYTLVSRYTVLFD